MSARLQTQTKAASQSSSSSRQASVLQSKCACGQHTIAGGECEECRQKHAGSLQRAAVNTAPVNAVLSIVHEVLNSPGQPLDAETRRFMEPRFGHDFSHVRVHTDAKAAESVQTVNAHAYAVRQDVVFGAGQYASGTEAGKRLMAHELAHAIQQRNLVQPLTGHFGISSSTDVSEQQAQRATSAVMNGETFTVTPQEAKIARQSITDTKDAGVKDVETRLGEQLLSQFPDGVAVAYYSIDSTKEPQHRAEEWAKRENALGIKGSKIKADTLVFGRSIPESQEIKATLSAIGKVLDTAVKKASPTADKAPNSAAKIHILAVFAHGTSDWCGLGSGITKSSATSIVKAISPALTSDVNVILYVCSTARGQTEKESWTEGTWEGSGADSLAGEVRDALLKEGLGQATVWRHTTVGHVSRNPALRQFKAESGKGTAGISYLSTYVFGTPEQNAAIDEIKQKIASHGYAIDEEKFQKKARATIKDLMYTCYMDADRQFLYQEGTLAEMAPIYPTQVADLIKDHWKKTYWPKRKAATVDVLIKKLKLKKAEK